jgi:hypothetical protein
MRLIPSIAALAATVLAGSLALAGNAHELRGEITRIDPSARTLVVKETAAPRQEVQLKLESAAQIVASGKPEAFADLKTGDQVRVSTTGTGAAREATRIEVLPAKSAHS